MDQDCSFSLAPSGVPSITEMDEAARGRAYSYAKNAGDLATWYLAFAPMDMPSHYWPQWDQRLLQWDNRGR